MQEKIFRARGTYSGTGKESYITNVWRRSKEEAQSDIDTLNTGRYTNTKIIERDWANFVNARSKLKHPLPRY